MPRERPTSVDIERCIKQAIQTKPRDVALRERYARWLRAQRRLEDAAAQVVKAKQVERFDPDFDYTTFLRDVSIRTIAAGEIIVVEGSGWEVFIGPAELQDWIMRTAPDERGLMSMPGGLGRPSESLLASLWAALPASDVPGTKLVHDSSWRLVRASDAEGIYHALFEKSVGSKKSVENPIS